MERRSIVSEGQVSIGQRHGAFGKLADAWLVAAMLVAVWCVALGACPQVALAEQSGDAADSHFAAATFGVQAMYSTDISDAYVYVASCDYIGAPVHPNVEVTMWDSDLNDVVLKEGTDYSVTFSNNVNVGQGNYTVKGIGAYTGTASGTFRIWERSLSDAEVVAAPIAARDYTGTAQTPEPVLKIGNYTLKKGTDYLIDSYYGNVNAGNASIYCKGIGNFDGGKYISFVIKQISISKANIVIPTQEYTGYTVEPDPDVSYDGVELSKYSDYTVTYKNNRYVGTATATISGSGNFVGTRTVSFKIAKAANSLTVSAKSKSIKVKGAASKARTISASKAYRLLNHDGKVTYAKGKVTAKGAKAKKAAKKFTVNKKSGALKIPKGTPKGTYKVKVKVTAKGDATHAKVTKTVTLKIVVQS